MNECTLQEAGASSSKHRAPKPTCFQVQELSITGGGGGGAFSKRVELLLTDIGD